MNLFNRRLITILLIGTILRVVLMISAYHQDLSGQVLSTHFLGFKGVSNIYEYLSSLPADHPLVKNFGVADIFIYPPLSYFTLGSYLKLISPLISENFYIDHMSGISMAKLNPIFHLFFLKLPYLLIDLLLAFVLTTLFKEIKQKRLVFTLWMVNPVTLYTTFAMGVFDIIPVLFTVLAVVFAQKNRLYLAALMIGFGAAFKSYPLFLLPFLVVSVKGVIEKIKLIVVGLSPYFLSIAPFLASAAFKYMVFGPKSQKMFFMQFPLSGAESLYPYMVGFVLLLIIASRYLKSSLLWVSFLIYFLLLFSITHYHPQWFLWLSPFLIIELVSNKFRNLYLVASLLFCYFIIILTFDRSLSSNLFAVSFPALEQFPGLDKIISTKTDLNFLRSNIRSIAAACSLYLCFDALKSNHEK